MIQILKIEDPRDQLQKATRFELCELAKAHGIAEITYGSLLQLPDMVRILHERGVHSIKIPERPLGVFKPVVVNAESVVEQVAKPAPVEAAPVEAPVIKPLAEMKMGEMRAECKRLGIKMARTDNLDTLREKLSGKNAA